MDSESRVPTFQILVTLVPALQRKKTNRFPIHSAAYLIHQGCAGARLSVDAGRAAAARCGEMRRERRRGGEPDPRGAWPPPIAAARIVVAQYGLVQRDNAEKLQRTSGTRPQYARVRRSQLILINTPGVRNHGLSHHSVMKREFFNKLLFLNSENDRLCAGREVPSLQK